MNLNQLDTKDLKWLLAVVTLISIVVFGFMARSDSKMFEFLGLAGTVISIVLAVVAIFYSFLQTFNSQRLEGDMRQVLARMDERTSQLLSLTSQLETSIAANNKATTEIDRKVDALLPSGKIELINVQRDKELAHSLQESQSEILQLVPESNRDGVVALLEQQKHSIMRDVRESDLKQLILAILASGGRYTDSDEWTSFSWLGGYTVEQIQASLLRLRQDGESMSRKDVEKVLDEMVKDDVVSRERWGNDKHHHYFIREHDALVEYASS